MAANTRYLLISNPPHGEVDAASAASHFGLPAAEVRMKCNYGLPEIWFAEEEEAHLVETSAALDEAGLNTTLVDGADLVAVPAQKPADAFVFTDEGLTVSRDDSEWTIPFDAPAIVVACRPRGDVDAGKSSARSVVSQLSSWRRSGGPTHSPEPGQAGLRTAPFLDLYVSGGDGLRRLSIVGGITGFPPLSPHSPHGMSGMRNLVAECEERFEKAYVDHRLVDMTLRGTARVLIVTDPYGPARSGFSYASHGLKGLLNFLSSDLKDISQTELSSRLAYLTSRSRIS